MKAPNMKKTPSALKWLAEKRARLAHDLAQTERITGEMTRKLENLRLDLNALDRALTIYDPAIDPTKIAAINGWQGNYGKRGSLRASVIKALQSHAPEWVATDNIEALVTLELGLSFELPALRKRWYDGSFRDVLKKLVSGGFVERQHDPTIASSELGRWRWKQEVAPTLKELRGHATLAQ